MISSDSTNNCSSNRNNLCLCISTIPCQNNSQSGRINNRCTEKAGNYRSSNCYRPLQQLYKTTYSPLCENRSAPINFACICRPSERYQTTNMSYGNFHYNNWAFMQKHRPINYDRRLFMQCYDSKKQSKMNYQSKRDNQLNG